mgnify:CR=1 FL=1
MGEDNSVYKMALFTTFVAPIKPDITVLIYRDGLNFDLVVRSRFGEGASVEPAPFVILNLRLYL